MSTEFWIQMIIYVAGIGSLGGTILARLNYLEKKMDKHNGLMERMASCETEIKSINHRIEDIK
jgi:hypothetical protein